MNLATFIHTNADAILDEWETFAAQIPAARGMASSALRDHAKGMLEAIAADLRAGQTMADQCAKAQGRMPAAAPTEAQQHGGARVLEGFSVNDAMSEFRALRASVIRLYGEAEGQTSTAVQDMIRFNEAIDQALTESLAHYSAAKDRQTRMFDALLSTSPDLSYIFGLDGTLLHANKAFGAAVGEPVAALPGKNIFDVLRQSAAGLEQHARQVVASGHAYQGELSLRSRAGRDIVFEYMLLPVFAPQGTCEAVAGMARDITERKATEERVHHSANYDQLTDLPNRSLFQERLDREIRHAARTGLPLALLFIDLDGFKEVNDRLGHAAGDALLRQVGERISACVRETDTVARLGGDEFTVILTEVTLPPHVEALSANILDALNCPFKLDHAEVSISGSVGITLYPADGATTEELLSHADMAMYGAKHAGRNRYRFFSDVHEAR